MGQSLSDLSIGCNSHIQESRLNKSLSTQIRDTARSIIRAHSIKPQLFIDDSSLAILDFRARETLDKHLHLPVLSPPTASDIAESSQMRGRTQLEHAGVVVTIPARSSVIPPPLCQDLQ